MHLWHDIRIALLQKWLERNGPWATYCKLAECLYEAGYIETLQVLCKELGGNLEPATSMQGKLVIIYFLFFTVYFLSTADKGHSCQYHAVLEYKDQLAKSLADGPDQHLLNQFRLKGWISTGIYVGAPGMIDEALTRIWSNASDYEVFIGMLPPYDRVKDIVDAITSMYNRLLVYYTSGKIISMK